MMRNHLLFGLIVLCVLSVPVSGVRAEPQADAQKQLLSAFAALKAHVTGEKKLSDEQIASDTKLIDTNKEIFGQSKAVMQAAMDFVAAHDAHNPYLFKGGDHNVWNRGQKPGGVKWTLLLTMQYLLDYAYTPANLAKYPDLLGQVKFATADYFPGPCPKPTDPKATYEVKLWASFPKTPAYDIWTSRFETHTARMATGAYLAPGTIATVTVPESLVGKGYAVRVGAASSDMSRKPRINRLFRISLLYPIDSTRVQVANPLGGGLYIEVPVGAHAGPVTVTFQNIVRAPFYADTRAKKTTQKQWLDQERHFKAPWADFQSEAYMMQVPTTWVYNLDDPVRLMSDWDRAVTAILYVMGYRLPDIAKVGLYLQPDTQLKHSVFSPGYPQVNYATGAEPGKDDCNGLKDIFYVTGPRNAPAWTFHEWGHYLNLPGPADEVETSNNILHVVAENLGLGVDFDKAFSEARRSTNRFLTVDNTAILWMTADNFGGGVMARLQKQYQLQGIGKYADVARLFGWSTLAEFYHRVLLQRAAYIDSDGKRGIEWPKGVDNDFYVYHLSKSSGIDMRPLLHFWGTPPWYMLIGSKSLDDLKKDLVAADADVKKAAAAQDALQGTRQQTAHSLEAQALRQAQARQSVAKTLVARQPEAGHYAKAFDELLDSGKIKRSAKIYDLLVKYKSLVPADKSAYQKFALAWYDNWNKKPPSIEKMWWTELGHRELWSTYSDKTAKQIQSEVQHLIDVYFPNGRPKE